MRPSSGYQVSHLKTVAYGVGLQLEEFTFTVVHRKGRNNQNADSISRFPVPNSAPPEPQPMSTPQQYAYVNCLVRHTLLTYRVNAITLPHEVELVGLPGGEEVIPKKETAGYDLVNPLAIEEIAKMQHEDEYLQTIFKYLEKKECPANYSGNQLLHFERVAKRYLIDTVPESETSLLFYLPPRMADDKYHLLNLAPRIVIPSQYRNTLLAMFHDSPFGGHLGVTRTFRKIAGQYYWEGMFKDIQAYIKACKQCQRLKPAHKVPVGKLKPLPQSTEPFEVVSMDFVTLPQSEDYKYIFTIIDHFTRWAIAIPVINKEARTVALCLINEVVCRYGCPKTILSDNGSEFMNAVMLYIYSMLGIKKIWSPAYRPQASGVIERFNGTLQSILRSICGSAEYEKIWVEYLQFAVYVYNTSVHEGTGFTPFTLL